MTTAAPFVGAVTTRPPAAFSSFTASAKRLTQSRIDSGSRTAGRDISARWMLAARDQVRSQVERVGHGWPVGRRGGRITLSDDEPAPDGVVRLGQIGRPSG